MEKRIVSERMAGKVCVITGTASGIGRETAAVFTEEGAHVVGVDLHESEGVELSLVADVTDEEQVRAAVVTAAGLLVLMAAIFLVSGRLLALHPRTAAAASAPPGRLVDWMIAFQKPCGSGRWRPGVRTVTTDQAVAEMMPTETRVSIVAAPCRAPRKARLCSGQAPQVTTGRLSASSTHCQPGKRVDGMVASTIDRSAAGTNSTSETISRRSTSRRSRSSARIARRGFGDLGAAVYPAASTVPVRSSRDTPGACSTVAVRVARLTTARTPSSLLSLRSTRPTHAAQVMPPTSRKVRCACSGGAAAGAGAWSRSVTSPVSTPGHLGRKRERP